MRLDEARADAAEAFGDRQRGDAHLLRRRPPQVAVGARRRGHRGCSRSDPPCRRRTSTTDDHSAACSSVSTPGESRVSITARSPPAPSAVVRGRARGEQGASSSGTARGRVPACSRSRRASAVRCARPGPRRGRRRRLRRASITGHVHRDGVGRPLGVDRQRGAVDEWSRHLDRDRHVGEMVLHGLERSDGAPELCPRPRVIGGEG